MVDISDCTESAALHVCTSAVMISETGPVRNSVSSGQSPNDVALGHNPGHLPAVD
jgi:hypothetical protein